MLLCCQCVVWSYCLCSLYNSWIDGGLFSGGLRRRWRRGFAGQRRWNGLQADKIRISTQEEKTSGDKHVDLQVQLGFMTGSDYYRLSDYVAFNCQTPCWNAWIFASSLQMGDIWNVQFYRSLSSHQCRQTISDDHRWPHLRLRQGQQRKSSCHSEHLLSLRYRQPAATLCAEATFYYLRTVTVDKQD